MESSRVFLLLIGISSITVVRQAHAVCCQSARRIFFTMEKGNCYMVGGSGRTYCTAKICPDGSVRNAYCGRGECNIFGCHCDKGCRTGKWSRTFEEKNSKYGIKVEEC